MEPIIAKRINTIREELRADIEIETIVLQDLFSDAEYRVPASAEALNFLIERSRAAVRSLYPDRVPAGNCVEFARDRDQLCERRSVSPFRPQWGGGVPVGLIVSAEVTTDPRIAVLPS